MPYTVTAPADVLDKLAVFWMQAADKAAVTQASSEIDLTLRLAPLARGADHGTHRSLTVEPLPAIYIVSPKDYTVSILDFVLHEQTDFGDASSI